MNLRSPLQLVLFYILVEYCKTYAKMPNQRTQSSYESKSTKINKARPAPDFGRLHSKWQEKMNEGMKKSKKPSTVVGFINVHIFGNVIYCKAFCGFNIEFDCVFV